MPRPDSDSIVSVPPIASADSRAIARPSPKPSRPFTLDAVEAVEDALLHGRRDARAGVGDLDRRLRAVLRRAQHDLALDGVLDARCRRGSRRPARRCRAARPRRPAAGSRRAAPRPSAGTLAAAISRSSPLSSTGSRCRFSCCVCARARIRSELESRVSRVAWRPIRSMKRSRLSGSSCAPDLQRLDRARDRGHRRAQLVRGVGDELALGLAAPLLLGDVGEHEHDEIRRRRGHADERDRRAVLALAARLGDRRARARTAPRRRGAAAARRTSREAARPSRAARRRAAASRARSRTATRSSPVDREHALVASARAARSSRSRSALSCSNASPSRLRMRSIVSARSPISSCSPGSSSQREVALLDRRGRARRCAAAAARSASRRRAR